MPYPYSWTPTKLVPDNLSQIKVLTYDNQTASLAVPISLTGGEIAFELTAPGRYKIVVQKGTHRYTGWFNVDETGTDTDTPEQYEYTRTAPLDPEQTASTPVVPLKYVTEDTENPGLYKISEGGVTEGRIVTVDSDFTLPVGVRSTLSESYAEVSSGAFAAAAMLGKIKRDWEDVSILLVGDSTGNSSGEWYYLLQQKMAAEWTTHTFLHYFWNDTTNLYDSPVTVSTGTGTHTVRFYNASVSGTKMDYLLGSKLKPAIVDAAPDLIFTSYGHNDGSSDVNGARNAGMSRILSLTETLAQIHPQASTIILTQNPRTDVTAETWGVRASRYDKAAEVAGRGFIDVHQVFVDTGDPAAYIKEDGVHPAESDTVGKLNGSDLWASAVYSHLRYRTGLSPRPAASSSFLYPVENLLTNGDFASFASPPTLPNWSSTNAVLSQDTTNFEAAHGYAVRMQSTAAGATSMFQDFSAAQREKHRGRWLTVAARVYVPEGQATTAARVGIEDGVSNITSIANASARGGFFWLVQSKLVDPNPGYLRIRVWAGSSSSSYDMTIDRVILSPGLLPRDIL